MKPIIINMSDMSDSTEIYESKPNPFLTGSIYLILVIAIIALVWMYFFKIDIVVKGTGTVAAARETVTITNQATGTITKRLVSDGQLVKAGDALYTISHDEQSLQLSVLENQLRDAEEKEAMLRAYETWLEEGTEFPKALSTNIYYNEIVSRKNLVELGELSTLQNYSGQLTNYDTKVNVNAEMLAYYRESIDKSRQLIEAIRNRENNFEEADTYYWNTMENYLAQYQYTMNQYEDKINAYRRESESAGKEIERLRDMLDNTQFNMEVTVSDGDVSEDVTKTSGINKNTIEEQLTAQRAIKDAADSNVEQCILQRDIALNAYEKESIVAIENTILGYEQNIAAYEGTQKEYISGQSTLMEQGTKLELENLVTQEKHAVAAELENCRQSKLQLSQQMEALHKSVEEATIKASIDGRVNFIHEPVEGNYLTAGTQVLSIIPDLNSGGFVVKSYVQNKDIAKVHEGMAVTYEIAAYPAREYGTMGGEVTFVSADLKVNDSGSAYYEVESQVDAQMLRNSLGEEGALKVGMLCETKIIVEEKRVLSVLIEKLFFR